MPLRLSKTLATVSDSWEGPDGEGCQIRMESNSPGEASLPPPPLSGLVFHGSASQSLSISCGSGDGGWRVSAGIHEGSCTGSPLTGLECVCGGGCGSDLTTPDTTITHSELLHCILSFPRLCCVPGNEFSVPLAAFYLVLAKTQ